MPKQLFKILAGFVLLFLLYHAAEYMIVFENSAVGFLLFQKFFFLTAFLLAKWQSGKGMAAWGLDIKQPFFKHLALGIGMGILLYGLTYVVSLLAGSEQFVDAPAIQEAAIPFLLFVYGSFFSSFSEDILTRGYIFYHLKGKVANWTLVLISALVYVLNHIYRLDDGAAAWLYLFALGILFALPLLLTNRLWFTGGLHWAGNCTFYLTHEVFTNNSVPQSLDANYILVFCIILLLPLILIIIKTAKLSAFNYTRQEQAVPIELY